MTAESEQLLVAELCIELPTELSLKFACDSAGLVSPKNGQQNYGELTIRLAVAHAHSIYEKSHPDFFAWDGVLVIDPTIRPWIGDLTTVPYGGATSGIEASRLQRKRVPLADTEQRIDRVTCEVVERAVSVAQLIGDAAAADLMRQSHIQEHTILRIISCAAFRRKTDRSILRN